jgi:hypothetical protein
VTQFFLFDAVRLFALLTRGVPHAMRVFLMWFQLCYPDLYAYQPAEAHLEPVRETTPDAAAFKLVARVLLRQG